MTTMKDSWKDSIMERISEKALELKEVALANRLQKELDTLSLEQILVKHLPASDPAALKIAADDMQHAIDEMYTGFGEQVTDDWVEAQFNSVLADHSPDEQGKWLVSFIYCAQAVQPDVLQNEPRWEELKNAETFQAQDVVVLLELAAKCTDENATFLARQEFRVMESTLQNLPYELIETQMNSGPQYAAAYAASMYITRKQSVDQQQTGDGVETTPYQLGALAANAVESSTILAQYHFGKVRVEDAIPKLQAQAKRMMTIMGKGLLQALAVGVRLIPSYFMGKLFFVLLIGCGVTSTIVLFGVPLLMATLTFLNFSQEETVEELTAVWDSVKRFVHKLVNFFRGEHETSSAADEEESVSLEEVQDATPSQNTNFVTT